MPKKRSCVQFVVPQILIYGAVKLIGAGLGDGGDQRSGPAAVFSAEAAAEHAELLKSIGVGC